MEVSPFPVVNLRKNHGEMCMLPALRHVVFFSLLTMYDPCSVERGVGGGGPSSKKDVPWFAIFVMNN
jgi:hypothetical protein